MGKFRNSEKTDIIKDEKCGLGIMRIKWWELKIDHVRLRWDTITKCFEGQEEKYPRVNHPLIPQRSVGCLVYGAGKIKQNNTESPG